MPEFRILGVVEVSDSGPARDLGGLRERTLLARLILAAGQVVSADRLAEDLWAGDPPPHSMATLRVYISRLRRALGPGSAALITQPPGYRIRIGPGQLDADRFEKRLAVFSGGCTLEAAEAVCPDVLPGQGLPAGLVLETVTALVDRSLLTTEERCGSMRYGMLESIHQFARAQLERAGESAELSRRHLGWLLGYAQQAELDGPDQGAWLDLLEADLENFRAALAWGLDKAHPAAEAALAIAAALAPFWMVRGHIGLGWLESALAAAGPAADPRLRAAALDGSGQLARKDYPAARSFHARSLELAEAVGELRSIAESLEEIAGVDAAMGSTQRAATLLGAAQALRDAIGSPILAPDLARFDAVVSAVRLALGEERFLAAEAGGRALTPAQAAALAREPAEAPAAQDRPGQDRPGQARLGQAAETSARPQAPEMSASSTGRQT